MHHKENGRMCAQVQNASALMTQNRPDIAVAFRNAHTNENVCDHKNIKTPERLQEVAG